MYEMTEREIDRACVDNRSLRTAVLNPGLETLGEIVGARSARMRRSNSTMSDDIRPSLVTYMLANRKTGVETVAVKEDIL